MMQMRNIRFALATVALIAAIPSFAAAQVAQQSTSVIDDLLQRAENSLNDLNYTQALTFAKQVTDLGNRITPQQRLRSMLVIAAANYPEGDAKDQHRDVSLATLKQLVRTNLDLTIPATMRWAGLDSILAEAKATTFGLAANAKSEQVVVGPTGMAEIAVRASRQAMFRVSVVGSNGSTVYMDSTSGIEGALRFPAMRNDRPLFPTGDYEIFVLATDRASGDTISTRFNARITSPELTFAPIPLAMDSSRLKAERTKRYGFKGIVVGGLVAGGVYGLSNTLHADTALTSKMGPDSKGVGIAAVAGLSVVVASFLDKGRRIPAAVLANQQLRDDFATRIRTVQAENANRIATYRTTMIITPGAR